MQQEARKRLEKVVVTNVSNRKGGAGRFLDPGKDHGNRLFGVGRSMTFDCPGGILPEMIKTWGDDCTVHDALDGTEVLGTVNGELTPAKLTPAHELQNREFMEDEEPNLKDAVDAALPKNSFGPIAGDLRQQVHPRVKITEGHQDDEVIGGELSPIPGDRPRDLDNSQQYTVRAPRGQHVGGIIGKK
jgi:hypothetical protein